MIDFDFQGHPKGYGGCSNFSTQNHSSGMKVSLILVSVFWGFRGRLCHKKQGRSQDLPFRFLVQSLNS